MRLLHVVGARPNFMKLAPVYSACSLYNFEQLIVHTGQHYDNKMSCIFFDELNIPKPDINLGVGSGSHSEQVANIMIKFEAVILSNTPDFIIVYGDVNSTIAAALVAAKLLIPIVHIEAGLRSFDRSMPEEVNRIVVDQLSEILFTPSCNADINLINEGIDKQKIFCVGNVMIDTLKKLLPEAKTNHIPFKTYALVTLHRPQNVDNREKLVDLFNLLKEINKKIPIVFPVHPRTRTKLNSLDILGHEKCNIHFMEPLGYLEFLGLQKNSSLIITDSGGIQEETTWLGIPCLTLRPNTERPVTINEGTNKLIWNCTHEEIIGDIEKIISGKWKKGKIPKLWDGKTGERIANILARSYLKV